MCIGARAAHALQHVNLLLVLFAGAILSTGARLRWDPTLYVGVRAIMPFEYRVLAGALPSAGAAMLAMAQLAIVASQPRPRPRRALLYTYAGLMAVGIALEIALGGWVYTRIVALINSPEAEEVEQILATKDHLQPLLQHLSRWNPIPEHINALITEAEEDAPWNGYVAAAALLALLILQLLGVVFAILAARVPTTKKKHHAHTNGGLSASRVSLVDSIRYGGRIAAEHCKLVIVWLSLDRSSLSSRSRSRSNVVPPTPGSVRSFRSTGGKSEEWAPLKAKYKNGILVPV